VLHVTVPSIPGAKVRSRRGGSSWQVAAKGVHAVQRLCVVSVDMAALTDLEVRVEFWRPPAAGWLGSPRLPGLTTVQITRDADSAVVQLATQEPVDA
jgi:hypothetical protein